MLSADVALANIINAAHQTYVANAPAYMTYQERTHVLGANRTEDINRSIAVRVADNYAVMRDLPAGAERTGEAFPIIAYFDPFSSFAFSYFANLKRVDINLDRGQPFYVNLPQFDRASDVDVAYFSYYAPRYAADSTAEAVHLVIDPTPRLGSNTFFPSDVRADAKTGLPTHIEMRVSGGDEVIALDYGVVDGHWVITHGGFSSTQRALGFAFKVTADVAYEGFTFPAEAPDPRLAGSPSPSPAGSASPSRLR